MLVFDYQENRQGIHARNFLGKWNGHLVVDDYSGYKALFGPVVTELGCMAHARRKFFDLHAEQPRPVTEQALTWFAKLYEGEREWKELGVEERARKRLEVAIPLLEKFHPWLFQQRKTTAPGSGLAKALDYTLKRLGSVGTLRHPRGICPSTTTGLKMPSDPSPLARKMVICRIGSGRGSRSGHPDLAGNGQNERSGTLLMAQGYLGEITDLAKRHTG
ncbi:MAG: transposase [Ferrovum myxofaciens]